VLTVDDSFKPAQKNQKLFENLKETADEMQFLLLE